MKVIVEYLAFENMPSCATIETTANSEEQAIEEAQKFF